VIVEFGDDDLDRLETDPTYEAGLPPGIVRAYRMRLQFIRNAPDERDFYSMKSLHFEKLKGSRSHQHSLRLNDQWRLIVELIGKQPNKVVRVVSIEDYH
jgi:proteic killer suppression protein